MKITNLFLILITPFLISGCGKDQPKKETLIILSPHNENIRSEFGLGFQQYYLTKTGSNVDIQWRNIGGSTTITQYLNNVYSRSQTSGADVLFGGGENLFIELTKSGYLEKMDLQQSVLDNIPLQLGGMQMRDTQNYWCAAAVSSFGFVYNKELLNRLNLPVPQRWEDLGKAEYFDKIMLADPTQSGSIAAAFEMIVQSDKDWQKGWAKLLSILSNSKKFAAASGTAADAPVVGEAPIAVCIDFYGTARVRQLPDKIGYISPKGQSAFTPDPVAILKNPQNRQLAQEFIDYLLSPQGQALWALKAGHPNGPKTNSLDRSPIRKDVFDIFAKDIPEYIPNPYSSTLEFKIDSKIRQQRYDILIELIKAAAIDNFNLMKRAKQKLINADFNTDNAIIFSQLPENADSDEDLATTKVAFTNKIEYQKIMTNWTTFFCSKYRKIIDSKQ